VPKVSVEALAMKVLKNPIWAKKLPIWLPCCVLLSSISNRDSKAYCRLAILLAPVAQQIAAVLDVSKTEFSLLIDSD
jgi:hypothetical protein